MERPISKTTIYISGAARFRDLIYIIAKDRGLSAKDVPHTRFIAFDQFKFAHMGDRNWSAVTVSVAKRPIEKMIAVSEDGDVFGYVGGRVTEETIKPKPAVLRSSNVIEGYVVVCGMKRQVYLRSSEKSWDKMHAPLPQPKENSGFEAITGYNLQEIYAVGWNGEIWQFDGKKWFNQDSPTNLILTGVCCGEDGVVYICGQHGTLIRGRNESWQIVELDNVDHDFWDIHWFGGKVYLSSMSRLFTYSTNNGITEVDFGADHPNSCYRLSSAEGVLWSVGSSDVFSFDGKEWVRVD